MLAALMVGVVVFVLESFGGAFSTYAVVDAQLPASSTAVSLGAPVEYRNVTVGTVASQGKSVPGGLVVVTLHLQPSMLQTIPAQVRATETPVSFFGDPYIELVPASRTSNARLRPGATIPALLVGQTGSLQATLGSLDDLLTKLHPAELDAALTALADRAPEQRGVVGAQPGPSQHLLLADAAPLAHRRVEPRDIGSGGEPVRRLYT